MKQTDKRLYYDSIAADWEDVMDAYDLRRRLDVVFNKLLGDVDLTSRKLLDAGCGMGYFSASAKNRGAIVTSLDIGPKLVEITAERHGTEGVVGDLLDLPFDDCSFDIVVSSEAIEHTLDPRAALKQLVRVLAPGGILVLTCPNYFWYWSCVVANKLGLRYYQGHENWPGWFEMRRWLKKENLAIESMQGIHLFPFVFKPLRPILKCLDCMGSALGPFYVNMALRSRRPDSE